MKFLPLHPERKLLTGRVLLPWEKLVCPCGHHISLHYGMGSNDCKVCDYNRKDPSAPFCLRYKGPLNAGTLLEVVVPEALIDAWVAAMNPGA